MFLSLANSPATASTADEINPLPSLPVFRLAEADVERFAVVVRLDDGFAFVVDLVDFAAPLEDLALEAPDFDLVEPDDFAAVAFFAVDLPDDELLDDLAADDFDFEVDDLEPADFEAPDFEGEDFVDRDFAAEDFDPDLEPVDVDVLDFALEDFFVVGILFPPLYEQSF